MASDSNVVAMVPPNTETPSATPGAKKPRAKKQHGPEFFDKLRILREKFALIYGTDTVFDGTTHTVQKIGSMRHAHLDAFDVWMKSPEKTVIMPSDVRFDPSRPEYAWNLFRPFESRPKKGECGLIIDHLRFLCANAPEAADWILNWCAIIVQKPGVKMRTAVLMHGNEGAGKNRFWEAFAAILSPYSKTIGQAELGRDFNEWASAALFLIANEVSTRREKFEIPGKLKGLISDPTIYINAKGMPPREEENRANFVFLSNETNPIPLGQTDRRYCVIWTPDAHQDGKAYYDRLSAQMRDGGVAAFHEYLLGRDVGEQDEYSRPPLTDARDDVIQASLGSVELWLRDVRLAAKDSDDAVAFVADEGFDRYRFWCRDANERHVVSRAVFFSTTKKGMRSRRWDMDVSAATRKQVTVYFDTDTLPDDRDIVKGAVDRFRQRHPLPSGGDSGY